MQLAAVDSVDAKSLQGLLDWQVLEATLVASRNKTTQGKCFKHTRRKEQQTTQGPEEMNNENT